MAATAEVEPHLSALLGYALSLERDRSRAEDIVQETLKRFYTYRGGTGVANLRGYLFQILRNVWQDQLREKKKGPLSIEDVDQASLFAAVDDPMDRLIVRDLGRAFELLPQEQQDVITLVALEGLSYQKTAERLGVATGTVMSRLNRARVRLKSAIEGDCLAVAAE